MMSKPPHVAVWVDVPNDCRMTGQFESDENFYFLVGDPNDEVHLRFEPEAMKRFVELAQRMLATPEPNDSEESQSTLVSPAA